MRDFFLGIEFVVVLIVLLIVLGGSYSNELFNFSYVASETNIVVKLVLSLVLIGLMVFILYLVGRSK